MEIHYPSPGAERGLLLDPSARLSMAALRGVCSEAVIAGMALVCLTPGASHSRLMNNRACQLQPTRFADNRMFRRNPRGTESLPTRDSPFRSNWVVSALSSQSDGKPSAQ